MKYKPQLLKKYYTNPASHIWNKCGGINNKLLGVLTDQLFVDHGFWLGNVSVIRHQHVDKLISDFINKKIKYE
jgi:hypothetical protein